METVEKRVQLDVDAYKVIIEGMNPTPMVYEPISGLVPIGERRMSKIEMRHKN